MVYGTCDNNAIKWGVFGPTVVSIVDLAFDISVFRVFANKRFVESVGFDGKFFDNLDCENMIR